MSCSDRPMLWNRSDVYRKFQQAGTADLCKQSGGSYYSNDSFQRCYGDCPESACMSTDLDGKTVLECRPRPLLSSIEIYYQVLADAAATCMDKSAAYRKAVEDNGGDPSTIGFNSDCPNPYAPAVVPDPTGQGVDGVFDPSASNGDPLKPQDAPPIDAGAPYIPPPPATYRDYDAIASATSPPDETLPTSRISLTDEEIDQFPKVNDYGTMREDVLAQTCRVNPTYCDVNTEHLADCEKYLKDFTWCCIPTQAEFDKLNDTHQCLLAENYRDIYKDPSVIKKMRNFAPSITITRDAPPVKDPVYENTPKERRRQQCNAQVGGDGLPCIYSGECLGTCNCGNASDGGLPAVPPPPPDWFKADGTTIALVAGGVILVGLVGYGIFKVASPAGRAMSMAGGNFGTSTQSVGIGGFKLVPT